MEVPTLAPLSRQGRMSSLDLVQARERLSARELEILELMSEGLSNRQIANRLWVSVETVKSHLSAVYAKLGAGSRAHAVAIGFRHGLLT